MHEGVHRVFRLPTFVIGMAANTRSFRKRPMKERFAIFCGENLARCVFNTNIRWLVAFGALLEGSGKWAVAIEAVVFQSLVHLHERPRIEQDFGKRDKQRYYDGKEGCRDGKVFHRITSSS
jgi:hypothetical protein